MSEKKSATPSLLSPEATGGDIATTGFGFQDAVMLAKIPSFLAQDGFTQVIREALCDFEASFFSFPSGVRREGFEAKDHRLTAGSFWKEIEALARLDEADPSCYGAFTLVSAGLSEEVGPVVNGLRRVRDPYPFYAPSSALLDASYAEYEQRVLANGKSSVLAQLLFDKVRAEPDWGTVNLDAEALFARAMNEFHPRSLETCRGADLKQCSLRLKGLIQSRKNQPILRRELEDVLTETLPAGTTGDPHIRLHTAGTAGDKAASGAIVAPWRRFFEESSRSYPPAEDWDREVVRPLLSFREWVGAASRPRRVRLSGNRRLSTSLAVGWALPAVAGFSIEMDVRGAVWATDAHPDLATPPYALESMYTAGTGDRLIVSVAIIRDVREDVSGHSRRAGFGGCPRLDLRGVSPIVSAQQLNLVVRRIKDEIVAALRTGGTSSVDLFLAGPSPMALFLGHRMNAVALTRCHEWVGPGEYTPTCTLGPCT